MRQTSIRKYWLLRNVILDLRASALRRRRPYMDRPAQAQRTCVRTQNMLRSEAGNAGNIHSWRAYSAVSAADNLWKRGRASLTGRRLTGKAAFCKAGHHHLYSGAPVTKPSLNCVRRNQHPFSHSGRSCLMFARRPGTAVGY